MNNKKLLNQAFKGLLSRLEKTEAFVLEQAPDICKQMVTEFYVRTVVHIIAIVIALFVVGSLATLAAYQPYDNNAKKAICEADKEERYFCSDFTYHNEEWYGLTTVLCLVFMGLLVGLVIEISEFYYIKNCPKLFLLLRFKELVE